VTPDPVTSHLDPSGVVTVTLNLPELRNALRPDLVRGLIEAMAAVEADDRARAVVLTGAGTVFCSGGDIGAMKAMASWSYEENLADSTTMDAMFASVERCSRPVVARVNGAAMGGGTGLVACADIAVATDTARFALSEVRLGIIPAVVGTYVAPKIGASWARRLLITGERFDARRALAIGLVHEVVPSGDLDGAVASVLEQVLAARPLAQRTIKAHLRRVFNGELATQGQVAEAAIEAAARARMSEEGQAGMAAFLDRP
jgi:methylglutaconyl-CoA hydratase